MSLSWSASIRGSESYRRFSARVEGFPAPGRKEPLASLPGLRQEIARLRLEGIGRTPPEVKFILPFARLALHSCLPFRQHLFLRSALRNCGSASATLCCASATDCV